MNASHIEFSRTEAQAIVVPDVVDTGCSGREDSDWLEFISLGVEPELGHPVRALKWRRAPVLLSF